MTAADILITNARILTMDGARPRAEALAITGNRIIRVGSRGRRRGPQGQAHARDRRAG